jgi:hypothetical protein
MKPIEDRKPVTPARMLRAHIIGIVVGQALGVIVAAFVKKYAEPLINPEGSITDALGKLVKNLPTPEPKDDMPPRPSRTAPPSGAGVGFGEGA